MYYSLFGYVTVTKVPNKDNSVIKRKRREFGAKLFPTLVGTNINNGSPVIFFYNYLKSKSIVSSA